MDAAGEVAQLLERGAGLRLRLVDELQRHAVRVVAQALAGHAELEAEGDEALLRAVVQVALDAPALGVGGGDDPRLCGAGVDHLRRELGVGLGVQEQPRPVAVRDAHAVDEVPGGDDQQRADRHEEARLGEAVDVPEQDVDPARRRPVPQGCDAGAPAAGRSRST